MRGKIQSANRTTPSYFEKSAKQLAFAASRATTAKSTLQSSPNVALFRGRRSGGPNLGGRAHGFHDTSLRDINFAIEPAVCPIYDPFCADCGPDEPWPAFRAEHLRHRRASAPAGVHAC